MELTLTAARAIATIGWWGAVALVLGPAGAQAGPRDAPIVLAQSVTSITTRAPNLLRQDTQYLDVAKRLRSQCENAAWTLWKSNSYDRWRNRKSSMMTMHYMSSSYPKLPEPPQDWPEPARSELGAAVNKANDLVKEAGTTFKSLADYINAKDYEDDKFKKGDELNARLLEIGETCHRLFSEMTGLYTTIAERLIEARKSGAAHPETVGTMVSDWKVARGLSQELALHEKADPAKVDALVKEISTLVDERKANFAPLKDNPDSALKGFYERTYNDQVAVKMRRFLRDAKSPKGFKDGAEDRPRSTFWSIRGEIDVAMPDAILRYIQSAK
ncbi:DUF3829 domain-containing protein [Enterovirga rhinocerotis]|uniref:Uncharacterized protein DUF3829 n=1 Tax=Enterovirga rhinocerotis TaxID=1339210 RepID=A0A4V3DZ73_9HYPH|nr:DUF3829 domain-containing protein [Enterovirga rhinocerotis]TDR94879.1 uncharacterized protein DUF3829 [Enterovirga rhinocerotis]